MRYALSLAVALVLLGCPLHDPVQTEPDYPGGYPPGNEIAPEYSDASPAAASSPCGLACAHLAELSCPEGRPNAAGMSCYRVCVRATRLRRLPVACWTVARDVDALRACGGGVRCVP